MVPAPDSTYGDVVLYDGTCGLCSRAVRFIAGHDPAGRYRFAALGSDVAHAVLRDAHVVLQGYRPGALAARGFAPDDMARVRPGIVIVALSAYGDTGPWAGRRGFDSLVQTATGLNHAEAQAAGSAEPQAMPVQILDMTTGFLMAFGAQAALLRQQRDGGSWLVRISLAQTGRWLVGRGQVSEAALKDVPKEFTSEELARWSTTSDTPVGRLHHLGPVVRLSETPPRWARPSVPLGYNEPVWPARAT